MSRRRREELDWHREVSQSRFNNGAQPKKETPVSAARRNARRTKRAQKIRGESPFIHDLFSDGWLLALIIVLALLTIDLFTPGALLA